ncbi:MAG: molybdopterin-synthase adenylyltransferase MoeB [Deinococcales bacterium]
MFTREQLDRYARHIILPGVGAEGQRRLLEASVLVVGAGGLGSPVLLYLAAAGVGRLHLVDDERVEASNLQRQVVHGLSSVGRPKTRSAAERLVDLNPDVAVIEHAERLTTDNARVLVRDVDLVLDGSDNFPTRYLVNDACVLEGTPLVYGALSQFEGQVSVFAARDAEGRGPCYRCLFPQPPEPGTVPSCAEAGVFGVLPGVVGSLMANEALKLLLGLGTPLVRTLLHVDAMGAEFRRFELARDPSCPVCGDHPTVTELVDYEAFCGLA